MSKRSTQFVKNTNFKEIKTMKKILLFLSMYFTFQNAIKAQYHPMLEDTTYWCLGFNFIPVHAPESRWFSYERVVSLGDTTIAGTSYKKIKTFIWFPPFSYFGAWREDTTTKRVYYVHAGDTTEQLMYDFNLNLGDTMHLDLHNNSYGNLLDGDYIVDSIAYVTIRTGLRKYMRLHNPMNPLLPDGKPFKLEWIESVGEIHDPLYLYLNDEDCYGPMTWDCNNHYSSAVIKQVHGNDKNYIDACSVAAINFTSAHVGSDTCTVDYFSSTHEFPDLFLPTSVYPNPNNGKDFTLAFYPNQPLLSIQITITDMTGKQVYVYRPTQIAEEYIVRDCSLEPGLYTIQISQGKVVLGTCKMVVN